MIEILETLKQESFNLVKEYGYIGVFILGYTEAIIQPFPPLPFISTAKVFGMNPYMVSFLTFISNILGAITAYFLGKKLGKKAALKIMSESTYQKAEGYFYRFGMFAIIIGQPFKAVCWLSGIFEFPFLRFLTAITIARLFLIALFLFFGKIIGKYIPG